MPRPFRDLKGLEFGKLTAIEVVKMTRSYWLCRCSCGESTLVRSSHLIDGRTLSCGCSEGRKTHGLYKSKTYTVWNHMKQRCTNPNTKQYKDYGGRGIKVCADWDSFENFLQDMGEVPNGMELDRIYNNGDYCKNNCRWTTRTLNNQNQRDSSWTQVIQSLTEEELHKVHAYLASILEV